MKLMHAHKLTVLDYSNETIKISLGIVFGVLTAVLAVILVVLLTMFLKGKGKQTVYYLQE